MKIERSTSNFELRKHIAHCHTLISHFSVNSTLNVQSSLFDVRRSIFLKMTDLSHLDVTTKSAVLLEALPYIQRFRDAIFVVK